MWRCTTAFERMMVDGTWWGFKLAPKLTGKAQQAYGAMSAEEAGNSDWSK